MKDILQEQHYPLQKALKNCLPQVASEMFSEDLISGTVKDEPTYDKLIDEFKAGMEWKDVSELLKHWQSFVKILSNQSGPAKHAANHLGSELRDHLSTCSVAAEQKSQNRCIPNNDGSTNPEEVILNDEDEVLEQLRSLQVEFVGMMRQFRKELREKVQQNKNILGELTDYIIDFIPWAKEDFVNIQELNDLFTKLHCYFDFLDCELIVVIAKGFVAEDLSKRLQCHSKQARGFRNTQSVKTLRTCLLDIYNPYLVNPENAPKVHIKLNNSWDEATVEGLYLLIRQFFPKHEKQSLLSHISISKGSVYIKYIIQEAQIDCLIAYAQGKLQFMRLIGMFGLVINDTPILDEDENMNFSFDSALFEAAKVGHIEAAQFLIELRCSIDVAFFEAVKNSHIEASTFLLELGAKIGTLKSLYTTIGKEESQVKIHPNV